MPLERGTRLGPTHRPAAVSEMLSMKVVLLTLASVLVAAPSATAQPESQFFDSDGVQIHYTDQGTGEPVVLIHGFTGFLELWEQDGSARALVASGYRVVSVDVRGHGQSDKPHDPAAYDVKVLDDIVALLDHLDLPQAHLVGYSMGGRLILRLLAEHQDRMLSAVVGGAGISETAAWRPPGSAEQIAAALAAVPDPNSLRKRNDPEALAVFRLASVTATTLPNITVPLAAIVGGDDPRLASVERLSDLHPATQVTVIRGYDHGATRRRPEFLAAVQQFLEGVSGR